MNKEALLEETYNSAFKDELEKLSGGKLNIVSKTVKNFGIPLEKKIGKKGVRGVIENMRKAKNLRKK